MACIAPRAFDILHCPADARDALIQSAEVSHISREQLKQLFYAECFPNFADTLLSGMLSTCIEHLFLIQMPLVLAPSVRIVIA